MMNTDQITDTVSHFWVSRSSFCFSTFLVAADSCGNLDQMVVVKLSLYDAHGTFIEEFVVQFPECEVGLIELEPFLTGLKTQGGVAHGHLIVRSREGTRHFCRQQLGPQVDMVTTPRVLKSREMAFIPFLLGSQREHLIVIINTEPDVSQFVVRLMYGNRAPEWTMSVPALGSRIISLQHELLATFEDVSWQRGVSQGYLRVSPRAQSSIVCQMIEQLPVDARIHGEASERINYRTLLSW